MEEYKFKVEFDYDIEKHVSIIYKMDKKIRTFALVSLIGVILFYVGIVVDGIRNNGSDPGMVILAVFLIFFFGVLLSSRRKRIFRNRLIKIYGTDPIKFIYEFYDEYIKIIRTGGDYESESKMKYSNIVKAESVDEKLGYISTKEQSIIFLSGNEVNEIVEFIQSKCK